MTVEVLQREYGLALRSNGTHIISTPRVETCIVWCGLDPINGVAFLCHFDFPFTANSIPKIINELAAITPANHEFQSQLLGGRPYTWSSATRRRIKSQISQQKILNINVEEGPYFKGLCGKGIYLNLESGEAGNCSGSPVIRISMKDIIQHNWNFFTSSEMKRAKGSA